MRRRVEADAMSIRLFDGIQPMLERLRSAGVRTAIVSSNAEQNIRRILGPQNSALIDIYDCGASLFGKARKLRAVVTRSGVPAARAICIGDETRDIEAAREAGIASGAVLWGYAKRDVLLSFAPTVTFESMSDIAALAG